MHFLRAAALAACFALAACSTTPGTSPPAAAAPVATRADAVVLVSIDAFRADYLSAERTPNLDRIAREGARAAWMNPSYPSLTFPNHYTLVTGLRPDRHGVIHNKMADGELGEFAVADLQAVTEARWWGGEPIWVTAEKNGLRSASWAWPGSLAQIGGIRPELVKPFDPSVPAERRVDDVLAWLDAPPTQRPRIVTMYFEQLDHAGHDYGPDSPQVGATLARLDSAVGRLYDGLAARGLLDRVDLVVVSDHGMAKVGPRRAIGVEDIVSPAEATVVSDGQSIGIVPNAGHEAAVAKKLVGAHDQYDCWRRGQLPERWHYGRNPRVPPIVCQMHEGWDALYPQKLAKRPPDATRGSHGYDPALPSMRALFIARGPSFVPGARLPAFDNVDVYPLLARLLGVQPAPNDGDVTPLLPALRPVAAP